MKLGLRDLRSKISIIPQVRCVPVFISNERNTHARNVWSTSKYHMPVAYPKGEIKGPDSQFSKTWSSGFVQKPYNSLQKGHLHAFVRAGGARSKTISSQPPPQ